MRSAGAALFAMASGNAVFATRDFVEKIPRAAIAAVKGRDPLVNAELANERLKMYVKELLLTKTCATMVFPLQI
jgi:hypothetical protein